MNMSKDTVEEWAMYLSHELDNVKFASVDEGLNQYTIRIQNGPSPTIFLYEEYSTVKWSLEDEGDFFARGEAQGNTSFKMLVTAIKEWINQ